MAFGTSRVSDFDRTLYNEAKLGAYYTDPEHCEDLGRFLQFSEDEVTACLEPSIGDGVAISCVVGLTENRQIYAVELNSETYNALKEKGSCTVLNADYLTGVTITPNSFPFVFSNPPYGEQDGERLERLFFEKIYAQMKTEGVLVFVIPHRVFTDRNFMRMFYNRMETLHVFKFRESEYKKFQQVGIIARKRKVKENILRDGLDALLERYSEENVPELPREWDGEKVLVPSGKFQGTFTTVKFPVEDCIRSMTEGIAEGYVSSFLQTVGDKVVTQPYMGSCLARPPIHPNKDSMYLLGVTGAGSGRCGNEGEGTLHLQRGVVKMVERTERQQKSEVEDDDGKSMKGKGSVLVATTRAEITYKVIEANGLIHSLK